MTTQPTPYDAIILGGGHNGLITAAYLARAGRRVIVLERRHVLGGASVTEEIVPGFKFSRLAYLNSLFRPQIIKDLDLHAHGLEFLPRNPSSFSPFPDGRYLLLGPDHAANQREIGKFSAADAEAYPKYEAYLERLAEFIEQTLDITPPDPQRLTPGNLLTLAGLGRKALGLGDDLHGLVDVLTGSATQMLDRWFESDQLKVTLATDAVIGAMAAPSMPGTSYVLLHHVMGTTGGARGVWAYVRGGMGALSQAIASSAQGYGAEIRTGAAVEEILVENQRAVGVRLTTGEEIRARVVASSADPYVTFVKLTPPAALPEKFRNGIAQLDFSSATLKINVALRELPNFIAAPGLAAGPQHRGTIHISPTMDYVEQAYDEAKYGQPSTNPVIEMTLPSVVDDTISPPGQHVASLFIQYAPYKLAEGLHWDTEKEAFADRVFEIIDTYAPNFTQAVIGRDVISPLDLEREFGLTGGNIFHGAMALPQMFFFRPVPHYADYRSPIKGLYLCGSGAHPGGGVMGAPGANAAREILKDLKAGRL